MVSLGCPKNRVDAEVVWAEAAELGLVPVDDPAAADIIVVNTCAFIQSAVEESVDTIVEMGRYKQEGKCTRLVVAGCLTPRYGQELLDAMPEVDLFTGPAEVGKLGKWLAESEAPARLSCQPAAGFLPSAATARANSLSPGSAYLKVAEGCSRRCSFCVIPSLRGLQQSRPLADVVAEAEALRSLGVREIVLVAQDLAGWGRDLKGAAGLFDLVAALADVPGLRWLRLMYLYPTDLSDDLLRLIAERDNVLAYLDVPVQHVDHGVLAGMRRGGNVEELTQTMLRFRQEIKGVVLRTSMMTGFPGETEAAFAELKHFVSQIRFERLGVFTFSPEEGTPAAALAKPVDQKLAERRQEELLALQQEIAMAYHQSLEGKTLEVLVESQLEEGKFLGRAWMQAPEVDGQTVIWGEAELGQIIQAKLIDSGPYDLEVEVLSES